MRWFAALLVIGTAFAQRWGDLRTPCPIPPGQTLVIGFLGGFEKWHDEHRGVVKLANTLRGEGFAVEAIENHRQRVARKLIVQAFDRNCDGHLDAEEKASVRLVLYGQSWGGAAAIAVARSLERQGIPVLLTVQIDSVGVKDAVIPANVRAAVNFYQRDLGFILGRSEIRAADPSRTRILGNYQLTYMGQPADWQNEPKWRRLGGSHVKMELDPVVWQLVEQYIRSAVR